MARASARTRKTKAKAKTSRAKSKSGARKKLSVAVAQPAANAASAANAAPDANAAPAGPAPASPAPAAAVGAAPQARPQAESAGDYRAKVRMYRQGLGDCFLISLPRRQPNGGRTDYVIMIDCGVVLGTPNPQPI